MSVFRFSKNAERDVDEIFEYIAQHNAQAADEFVALVAQKSRFLAKNPRVGAKRSELMPGLRAFPLGKYVIFFRETDDIVEIVRVIHGARDIPSQFSE